MRAAVSLLLVLLCGLSEAYACSCSRPRAVAEAFKESDDVFLARIDTVDRVPTDGDTTGHYWTETVRFVVLEAWKGDVRPGSIATTRSRTGGGNCGESAWNDPMWSATLDVDAETTRPTQFSGTWLIYREGGEPHELSHCGNSKPIEHVGEAELAELNRLRKDAAPEGAAPEDEPPGDEAQAQPAPSKGDQRG